VKSFSNALEVIVNEQIAERTGSPIPSADHAAAEQNIVFRLSARHTH
jgi:hypothetical protein